MKRILTLCVCCTLALAGSAQRVVTSNSIDEQIQKLLMAETAISNLYIDQVSDSLLVEKAIRAMLKELDPHSTYLTPKEVSTANESLNGNFDGIGIQFNMVEDTLFVVQTILDGPSEKAGIMAGDRIVTVNDTAIAGVKMNEDAIKSHLRGPRGTHVKLGVKRAGIGELIYFDIVRDKIPVNSLDAYYMATPSIGYIKIGNFGATTDQEFRDALQKLNGQGMQSLIIDLQDNGGGYLQSAISMANEFLARGQLIVYTEGNNSPRSQSAANGNGVYTNGQVAVLIDEYSASASEILSGAIQDWDRGIIVGRRSFGKGLVQRQVEFPDHSVMRLTIAKYYTPSGRCIQKPYGEDIDYAKDVEQRLKHGELTSLDSIHFADSLKYTTASGRTVYGGGGIMPDYFVPLDTTEITPFYRQLSAKGVILQSSLAYVDRNRKQVERKYKTFRDFDRGYEVDDKYLDILLSKAKEQKIEFKQDEYDISLQLIQTQLKALVARNVWGMNEYFTILGRRDPILQKAIAVLEEK